MSKTLDMPFGESQVTISVPGDAIVAQVLVQPALTSPDTAVREALEVPPLGLQRAFSNFLFEKLVDGNLIMAGATMPGFARSVHWIPTRTFDDAFRLSKEILGNNSEIVVVPRVRSTIVSVKEG